MDKQLIKPSTMSVKERQAIWTKAYGSILKKHHPADSCPIDKEYVDYDGMHEAQFIKMFRQVENKWNVPGWLSLSCDEILSWLASLDLCRADVPGLLKTSKDIGVRMHRLTIGAKARHTKAQAALSEDDKMRYFIALVGPIMTEEGNWDTPFFKSFSRVVKSFDGKPIGLEAKHSPIP